MPIQFIFAFTENLTFLTVLLFSECRTSHETILELTRYVSDTSLMQAY